MFDPFEALGLEKCFDLDMKVLEQHYFEKQRTAHPDQFICATLEEKTQALRKSTELNQAYLLLKDPIERALFLLKERNVEPLTHDAETLHKVMEWNERFEAGEDLSRELLEEKNILVKEIKEGFRVQDLERVRIALYLQTYVQKLLRESTRKVSKVV